jgi:hypothetical protein
VPKTGQATTTFGGTEMMPRGEKSIIETAVVSEERIRENEMLRCILEPYLNDVEGIGWGNLSATELFDILIESILNHNSFLQCDYYRRLEYKRHEMYPEILNRPQLGDDLENAIFFIPWGHNKVIIRTV